MVSVDSSIFIQIVNFLLLIFLLNIFMYKPIRRILRERKEKVGSLENGIQTAEQEAKDKEDAFASGVKSARVEGLKEKETLMQEASQKEKEIIEKINEDAQAKLAEVRSQISNEADGVRTALMKEVDSFASAIGQKILGRAV